MSDKCRYTRTSEIEQYTPDCCIEYDDDGYIQPTRCAHPEDVEEWVYCPFCGDEIKIVEQ